MNTKAKGSNAEREIIHLLWKRDWAAVRVAGSGSIKYPAPDIIAGKNGKLIVIEAKCTASTNQYFTKKEIEELKTFANMVGAHPYVAIKFGANPWYVLQLEDLNEKSSLYGISLEQAKLRGLLIDEVFED